MKLLSTSISSVLALGLLVVSPSTAGALTWFDAGTGVWNDSNTNWNSSVIPNNGSGGTAWSSGQTANFIGAGSAVAIGSDLAIAPPFDIGAISFGIPAGSYTFNNSGFTLDFTGTGITTNTPASQTINNGGTINFNNSSSARDILSTGGTLTISNSGAVNFLDSSTAGGAVITNTGTLILGDTASGGSASISNGGVLDISGNTAIPFASGTPGLQTLGSLTNFEGSDVGFVRVGKKTLSVGNVTLASGFGPNSQSIEFTLDAPGASSGKIVLNSGVFSGSLDGETDITLTSFGPVTPGTYTLIDWSAASSTGVNIEDFNLIGPLPGGLLPSSHLVITGGNMLQLVAVPEPSTFMMPLVAVLGMVWMRRRAARATV